MRSLSEIFDGYFANRDFASDELRKALAFRERCRP